MTLEDHLNRPLAQLRKEFFEMFPKYGTSWKEKTKEWLLKRLLVEVKELLLSFLHPSFKDVVEKAFREIIYSVTGLSVESNNPLEEKREEVIDVALVALMLLDVINEAIDK